MTTTKKTKSKNIINIKPLSSFPNLHIQLAQDLHDHMKKCKYSNGTINMRLGNLNFLFGHYGAEKMTELLKSSVTKANEAAAYIYSTLPSNCIKNADVSAFKLAWESQNGVEIVKKRTM